MIGGGPGGYTAAIRGGQLGLDTTLVEMDAYGGTCLNVGCIPSKAYITAADMKHRVEGAEDMGIHARADVDMLGLKTWKDGVVDQLTGGVEKLCKANGVNLVEGRAEFAGENRVRFAAIMTTDSRAFGRGGLYVNQTLASKRSRGPSGLPLSRADLYA